jgi:hypothetical protein
MATMSVVSLALAVGFGTGSAAPAARPEPHLSIRTGLHCSHCHINRTGGGGRNDFGSLYGQAQLPLRTSAVRARPAEQWLSVGGDLRVLASGTFRKATPRSAVSIEEANLQFAAQLVPDVLTLYVDETIGPGGAFAREAFALLDVLPANGYVKAGKFLLPYGYRLPDDAEYIRSRTGFTYATPDLGVEVGLQTGALAVALAMTNGTQGAPELDDGKQVMGTASFVFPRFRLGASASRSESDVGSRDVVGAFGGVRLGPLVGLGEVDLVRDDVDGSETEQLVGYVEADLLARQGVNIKATYGYLDPSRAIAENARVRGRMGVELYPVSSLRLSAFYLLLDDIPQARTDIDRWNLELYVFF